MIILLYILAHVLGSVSAYKLVKRVDRLENPTGKLNKHDVFAIWLVSIVGSWLAVVCALCMLWEHTYNKYTNL